MNKGSSKRAALAAQRRWAIEKNDFGCQVEISATKKTVGVQTDDITFQIQDDVRKETGSQDQEVPTAETFDLRELLEELGFEPLSQEEGIKTSVLEKEVHAVLAFCHILVIFLCCLSFTLRNRAYSMEKLGGLGTTIDFRFHKTLYFLSEFCKNPYFKSAKMLSAFLPMELSMGLSKLWKLPEIWLLNRKKAHKNKRKKFVL